MRVTEVGAVFLAQTAFRRMELIDPDVPGKAPDAIYCPQTGGLYRYVGEVQRWMDVEGGGCFRINDIHFEGEVYGLWR